MTIQKCDPNAATCLNEDGTEQLESPPPEEGLQQIPGPTVGELQGASVTLERLVEGQASSASFDGEPIGRAAMETLGMIHELGRPVPAGVRYPVLSRLERDWVLRTHYSSGSGQVSSSLTYTYSLRNFNALTFVQRHFRGRRTPVRVLIVGAGFGFPNIARMGAQKEDSPTVWEYASVLSRLGVDFRLDVLDSAKQIETHFETVLAQPEHRFIVYGALRGHDGDDGLIPKSFSLPRAEHLEEVFKPWMIRIPQPGLKPAGSIRYQVTVPGDVLNRVRFERGSILEPLPGFGRTEAGSYDLVVFENVMIHLDGPVFLLVEQNVASNLAPGGILITDLFRFDSSSLWRQHGLEKMPAESRLTGIYRRLEEPTGLPHLMSRGEQGWRVVTATGQVNFLEFKANFKEASLEYLFPLPPLDNRLAQLTVGLPEGEAPLDRQTLTAVSPTAGIVVKIFRSGWGYPFSGRYLPTLSLPEELFWHHILNEQMGLVGPRVLSVGNYYRLSGKIPPGWEGTNQSFSGYQMEYLSPEAGW
ncbi:MAG: hypothetical protein Q7S00_01665, partial [bacterium]|nr:hypothetical protein [bacterium]